MIFIVGGPFWKKVTHDFHWLSLEEAFTIVRIVITLVFVNKFIQGDRALKAFELEFPN